MTTQKTLLALYAHPDDEILGAGGTLAHHARQGVHIELVCTTRGEAGEISDPALATPQTLGQVREQELRCSAATLGIDKVTFLGYRDSGMAGTADNDHPDAYTNAATATVVAQLVKIIRRIRPQVMLTFEPYGGYGHPDHIAIHEHTLAAFEAAADPTFHPELGAPWQTKRLFYPILTTAFFQEIIRRLEARGEDMSEMAQRMEERKEKGWPEDEIHLVMDIAHSVDAKWNAFHCHRTQFGAHSLFRRLPETEIKELVSHEYFALARPQPTPGFQLNDLFEGIVP